MKRIVIALGGNALQEAGKPATAESQLEVVEKTSTFATQRSTTACASSTTSTTFNARTDTG